MRDNEISDRDLDLYLIIITLWAKALITVIGHTRSIIQWRHSQIDTIIPA